MASYQPYRSRKLGTKALEEVLAAAASHSKPKITHVQLHVQENNQEARRFYERHGFKLVGKEEEYYKKIEPHGAWILEKEVREEGV
jgi:ribosomal protein S18 acetylase RimI-like enzyme